MSLTIAQLRASKTTNEIDEALATFSLPPGMSVEEFVIQLLDTYYNAQALYNEVRPIGEKLDFVRTPTISNPRIIGNGSSYSLDKSYVIRAKVNVALDTVEPVLQ